MFPKSIHFLDPGQNLDLNPTLAHTDHPTDNLNLLSGLYNQVANKVRILSITFN